MSHPINPPMPRRAPPKMPKMPPMPQQAPPMPQRALPKMPQRALPKMPQTPSLTVDDVKMMEEQMLTRWGPLLDEAIAIVENVKTEMTENTGRHNDNTLWKDRSPSLRDAANMAADAANMAVAFAIKGNTPEMNEKVESAKAAASRASDAADRTRQHTIDADKKVKDNNIMGAIVDVEDALSAAKIATDAAWEAMNATSEMIEAAKTKAATVIAGGRRTKRNRKHRAKHRKRRTHRK